MGARHTILTPKQAADLAGVTVRELAALTAGDDGPPYIAMGPRLIRYIKADITAWMKDRATTEDPAAPTHHEGETS
jgi:predicted DNA-binding transcriptional regulator AlpA